MVRSFRLATEFLIVDDQGKQIGIVGITCSAVTPNGTDAWSIDLDLELLFPDLKSLHLHQVIGKGRPNHFM